VQEPILGHSASKSKIRRNHTAVVSNEHERPLHFLLRFSDDLRKVDTYGTHKAILDRLGFVWFGKFGTGISHGIVDTAHNQIAALIPTYLYLLSKGQLLYRGQIDRILGGGGRARLRPTEIHAVPQYYRGEYCPVWFKLTDLHPLSPQEASMPLVLYSAPALAPQLNGMQSLIYVSYATQRTSSEDGAREIAAAIKRRTQKRREATW